MRMRLRPDWASWLHRYRIRCFSRVFSRFPEKVFATGLELGGGDGFVSTLLTRYVGHLISTDYDPLILRNVGNSSLEYRVLNAEEVADMFEAKQFEVVFSSNVMEHVPNTRKTLNGIHTVLKDDGITIHFMPSMFWKFCNVACYYPAATLRVVERTMDRLQARSFGPRSQGAANYGHTERCSAVRVTQPEYPTWSPPTHGVLDRHLPELYAFRKSRWLREFADAGFTVVAVLKLPPASGYGFGLESLRRALTRFGLAGEYVYVATKAGHTSPFARYF